MYIFIIHIRFALLLFFTGISFCGFSQDILQKYCYDNYTSINSIHPDSLNYSDLAILGEHIGEARVVMLGEQAHGDASTFLAKTRVIKYLHEVKGFDVLAFEGDFFALDYGWNQTVKSDSNKKALNYYLRKNIYDVWSKCNAIDNLYNYVIDHTKSDNPIIITGFDNQALGSYSETHLVRHIDSFIVSQKIAYSTSTAYKDKFIPLLVDFFKFELRSFDSKITNNQLLITYIDTIYKQLLTHDNYNQFDMINIRSLQSFVREYLYYYMKEITASIGVRDQHMALNLTWLIKEKYADKKIIVWAANAHTLKAAGGNRSFSTYKSMGQYISEDSTLRNMVYVLGFDSKQGKAGQVIGEFNNQSFNIPKPPKNAFENWLPNNSNYGFIDFKKFNLINPKYKKRFYMKACGHVSAKASWNKMFDGIFYIKNMESCIDYNRL